MRVLNSIHVLLNSSCHIPSAPRQVLCRVIPRLVSALMITSTFGARRLPVLDYIRGISVLIFAFKLQNRKRGKRERSSVYNCRARDTFESVLLLCGTLSSFTKEEQSVMISTLGVARDKDGGSLRALCQACHGSGEKEPNKVNKLFEPVGQYTSQTISFGGALFFCLMWSNIMSTCIYRQYCMSKKEKDLLGQIRCLFPRAFSKGKKSHPTHLVQTMFTLVTAVSSQSV